MSWTSNIRVVRGEAEISFEELCAHTRTRTLRAEDAQRSHTHTSSLSTVEKERERKREGGGIERRRTKLPTLPCEKERFEDKVYFSPSDLLSFPIPLSLFLSLSVLLPGYLCFYESLSRREEKFGCLPGRLRRRRRRRVCLKDGPQRRLEKRLAMRPGALPRLCVPAVQSSDLHQPLGSQDSRGTRGGWPDSGKIRL